MSTIIFLQVLENKSLNRDRCPTSPWNPSLQIYNHCPIYLSNDDSCLLVLEKIFKKVWVIILLAFKKEQLKNPRLPSDMIFLFLENKS